MPLAREIFQEGLIIPPVKLVRRGAIVADVLALMLGQRADAGRARGRPHGADRRQSRRRDRGCARSSRKYGRRARRRLRGRACRTTPSACCARRSPRFPTATTRSRTPRRRRLQRAEPIAHPRRACASPATARSSISPASDPQIDRRRERQLRDHAVGDALRLPLPRARGRALQRRHRAGRLTVIAPEGSDRQRAAAVGGGRRQRRDVAAHHRRRARRAGAGAARSACRPPARAR